MTAATATMTLAIDAIDVTRAQRALSFADASFASATLIAIAACATSYECPPRLL
jgi:hypothetical protein